MNPLIGTDYVPGWGTLKDECRSSFGVPILQKPQCPVMRERRMLVGVLNSRRRRDALVGRASERVVVVVVILVIARDGSRASTRTNCPEKFGWKATGKPAAAGAGRREQNFLGSWDSVEVTTSRSTSHLQGNHCNNAAVRRLLVVPTSTTVVQQSEMLQLLVFRDVHTDKWNVDGGS